MARKGKEVQEAAQMIVQGAGNRLPDYIKQGGNRGNENVTTDDLVVPRIEVVQALSPCLDEKNEAAYIPGIKQGQLFNSLNRRVYGSSVTVVPILFSMQWLVWRDRKKGGGFRGAYPTEEAANDFIRTITDKDGKPQDGWEALSTAQHLVLIARADGVIEEAMLSMARTKLKVSRQWNSLVRQAGDDRFSRAYEIAGTQERNSNNEVYYNFAVRPFGYPNPRMYEAASKFYDEITSGRKTVVMDMSDIDDAADQTRAQAPGQRSEF